MIVALFFVALILNAVYCIIKIAGDWKSGNREMAAVGVICVLALNGCIVWILLDGLARSTDL